MAELRLHRSLYPHAAIDQAVGLYAGHAAITRADDGEHIVLTITSAKPERAERIARELGNYALGLTIQSRGADQSVPLTTGAR